MRTVEPQRDRSRSARSALRRSARGGFTLLEVLAAALILALWYTALAGSSYNALRAEGESLRLLEAGMLADRYLARALATTVEGSVPEPGQEIAEEGPYLVETSFGSFDQVAASPQGMTQRDNLVQPVAGEKPPPDLASLLASEMPEMAKNIRSIKVTVSWSEGRQDKAIERTTFVFDAEKAAEVYENTEAPDEGSAGDADEESETE
jgi:prepilin-type N-terminal cleavage/methylation domain-containing protein